VDVEARMFQQRSPYDFGSVSTMTLKIEVCCGGEVAEVTGQLPKL
jgi:hypothetical protein